LQEKQILNRKFLKMHFCNTSRMEVDHIKTQIIIANNVWE